jgi:recombination associated protein RdgC
MKLIKNAIVYSATLPAAADLAVHLAERPWSPILETQLSQASFVPVKITKELVTEFDGGYCFSLRLDEKILPKSIVKARADERIARVEASTGQRMKKIERIAIYDNTMAELARTALVKTAVITAFYNIRDNYLIVPVTSSKLANVVIGTLIQVVGSVKTTTIHISDIKHGLSTRLKAHLGEEKDLRAFESAGFKIGEQVNLQKAGGEKVNYKLESLDSVAVAIIERLDNGFTVNALSLESNGVDFKLTQDFTFKQIAFPAPAEADEGEDGVFLWCQEAAVQVLLFSLIIRDLCNLLGYQPPETEPVAVAA